MKITECITFKTTTIASLKQYDMFVLASPKVIYMYIMTYTGPKYLELSNGTWKDSNVIFSVVEQVSIVSFAVLQYMKI